MTSPFAPSFVRRFRGFSLVLALIAAGSIGAALAQSRAAATSTAAATVHGLDPADMNLSASACQDYYQFADGGWLKKNPVPPEYPSWGTFPALAERNREAMRKILDKLAAEKSAPGSEEQKIGDFYASCMDEAAIEAAGAKPLSAELARIDKIQNLSDLRAEVASLQAHGVGAVFGFGSQQDRKNSSEVIAGAFQGGLGLPDRDYYTKTDDKSKDLRGKYAEHVAKMFTLLGDDPARAAAQAKAVLEHRDEAGRGVHDAGREAGPRRDVSPDGAGGAEDPDAELLLGSVLPRRWARRRSPPSTSASRSSSRRWTRT